MRMSITLHDLSTDQASRVVEFSKTLGALPGMGGPVPTPAAQAAPAPAAPPPAAAAPAAPPPPPAVAAAPAAAPAPAAPPPPPAAPAAAGVAQADLLAAMQSYSAVHKAAGVKAILAKCGLTKITEANPQQAEWLLAAFKSGQAPAAFG